MSIKAWVATAAKQKMVLQDIDLGSLGTEEVEVAVEILRRVPLGCFGMEQRLGHFSIPSRFRPRGRWPRNGGRRDDQGSEVRPAGRSRLDGVELHALSAMYVRRPAPVRQAQPTIFGHRGGFATHVRCHWAWAVPLPEGLKIADAGPLLCGGVTVFHPLDLYAKPTSHVGIVGIGGLGHMAVKFAAAYGCDVTAFTSSESKFEEARGFGAKHVVSSRDSAAIKKLAGTIDLLIVTVNVRLDWDALIGTLAPNGRMHVVGAVAEPIPVAVFPLILGQRSISGSPTGSPVDIGMMLEYAARHDVAPQTEHYPMSQINEAFQRLEAGKARYRIVLDADF